MAWYIKHPEPSNVGEPQSVRDAYDAYMARKTAEEIAQRTAVVEQEAEAE